MSVIWFLLAAIGTFVGGTAAAILSDIISEEVRSRLDVVPHALVRLASLCIPHPDRRVYQADWIAVLDEILHGAKARPITRLVLGIRFSLSSMRGAWQVRRELLGRQRLARFIPPLSFFLFWGAVVTLALLVNREFPDHTLLILFATLILIPVRIVAGVILEIRRARWVFGKDFGWVAVNVGLNPFDPEVQEMYLVGSLRPPE